MKENEKHLARKMRHARVRKKLKGSNERPRLAVFKSSKHIYAQVIDDESSRTLTAVSTLSIGYYLFEKYLSNPKGLILRPIKYSK